MRLKFTGKSLLVKNRNGFYQERFYVWSKFRCKSVVNWGIHGGGGAGPADPATAGPMF